MENDACIYDKGGKEWEEEEEGEEEQENTDINGEQDLASRNEDHVKDQDAADGQLHKATHSEDKNAHSPIQSGKNEPHLLNIPDEDVSSVSGNSNDDQNSVASQNIYDDTKPKRLKQNKNIKLDLTSESDRLMKGIDVLISPDENSHRSPTRRRGISETSSPLLSLERQYVPYNESMGVTDKTVAKENVEKDSTKRPSVNVKSDLDRCSLEENDCKQAIINEYGTESGYRSDSDGEISTPDESDESCQSISPKRVSENVICEYEHEVDMKREQEASIKQVCYKNVEPIVSSDVPRMPQLRTRKISSDAVIDDRGRYRVTPRKISADANLERRYATAEEPCDAQLPRKRRVSFGMVAYVRTGERIEKGIAPLNDEMQIHREPENYLTKNAEILDKNNKQNQIEIKDDDQTDGKLPTFQIAIDETSTESNGNPQSYLSDKWSAEQEKYRITNDGLDNPSFVNDEEKIEDIFPYAKLEVQSEEDLQKSNQDLPTKVSQQKKISTQSLPVGIDYRETKRLSWQSDDSPMPKSILKNKTASSDSLASESSVNEKRFKVRKDSIALFTDQHGQVGLAALRKEYGSDWKSRFNIKMIWSKRREIMANYKTNFFVFGLFSCILVFVIVGLYLHNRHKHNLAIAQKVFFDAKARQLYLNGKDENDHISGRLGLNVPKWLLPSHCYADYENIHDRTCLIWKGFGELNIHFIENDTKCYNVSWKMKPGIKPRDCFNVDNNYWYGPSNYSGNSWPISWNDFTFDTSSAKHDNSGTFEFVTEYYWLATNGGAIFVNSNFPLHVDWNKKNTGDLCISVSKSGDFYSKDSTQELYMNYVVCKGKDILTTHTFMSEQFIPRIQETPDESIMKSPHWSTLSLDRKSKVNESIIQDLTRNLAKHQLNCSTIELDGQWERKVGDFSFDKRAFTNMTDTLKAASDAKCKLSLYLYPYFDISSRNFNEGLSREAFIKSIGKQVPALVKLQHGIGAMLDVSNSSARLWFTSKIKALKSLYGIDTFRFVYGNSYWLPHKPVFSQEQLSPNRVKRLFSDLFSSFGDVVIKSTSRTQHLTGLIGLPSLVMKHKQIKCLKNIIPDILNLGHLGYPFIMSDGFEIGSLSDNELIPGRDLFIRWMQLSVFLPAMRYTIKPWAYDKEVINLARNLSKFHAEIILPEIKKLQDEILQGKPIIRPLWWLDPYDSDTFQINDQFLLSDKYLVAPILCEGESGRAERDIYVPKGIWRDVISNTIIPGPKMIRGYHVNQNDIIYFKREELHFSVQ